MLQKRANQYQNECLTTSTYTTITITKLLMIILTLNYNPLNNDNNLQ